MIALNLANNTYKPVYVPDEEDICVKEYFQYDERFQDIVEEDQTRSKL